MKEKELKTIIGNKDLIPNDVLKSFKRNKEIGDALRENTKRISEKLTYKEVEAILIGSNLDFSDENNKFEGFLVQYNDNKYVNTLFENELYLFKAYCFSKKDRISSQVNLIKDELREIIGDDEYEYTEYLKISSDICNNFQIRQQIYLNNIKNRYLELILCSENEYVLNENIFKFIFGNFNDYIEYLKEFENKEIKNYWDILYYAGNYVKTIVGTDFINIDINVFEMSLQNKDDEFIEYDEDEKYSIYDFFRNYEIQLKRNKERLNNEDIIVVTQNCKDRIIELFSLGLSKNKLIDVISNELWDKKIIERTVKRSNRKKGIKNEKIVVDNKISKNVVDKIIDEYINNKNQKKI